MHQKLRISRVDKQAGIKWLKIRKEVLGVDPGEDPLES
jgi:hypothetical protein